MKLSILLSTALLTLASALPANIDVTDELAAKLKAGKSSVPDGTWAAKTAPPPGTTANDFLEHGCQDVIFLYARGSTQDGNIGLSPGPQTIALLRAALGNSTTLAAQGLDYPAALLANLLKDGCNPKDATAFGDLITKAVTQCPASKVVISGYSQGAALVHAAAKLLSPTVADGVVAAVTYGDTRKKQDRGMIPGLDPERTLILCHEGDFVCKGTLLVLDAHFDYEDLAPEAVEFILSRI